VCGCWMEFICAPQIVPRVIRPTLTLPVEFYRAKVYE
jgi:hypothetical protein